MTINTNKARKAATTNPAIHPFFIFGKIWLGFKVTKKTYRD
jgi:hypothetical protein